LNYPISRVSKILLLLLNQHRAISLNSLEDRFYVSKSTILNDLKKIEEILEDFDLELLRGSNKIIIDGKEIDKRRCLSEQDLYLAHIKNEKGMLYVDERQLTKIKNILTDIFVEYNYHIMDSDFNNAILFVNIMICRMGDGFYLQTEDLEVTDEIGREYEISKAIMEKIGRRFFVKITEEEIQHLAVYLRGQGNLYSADTITPEMNELIMSALQSIRDNSGIDLTDNVNLRITLALHCMSLSVRIKYDMQIKNDMLDYIRESFPLGYDVAAQFAYLLQKQYGKKVTEDEIALLAVHFYSSLSELNQKENKKKILVISTLKNSMSILLKQTLSRWFSEYVSTIDFVDPMALDPDMLDEYEIFLTTEKGEFFEKGLAMYVDPFPKERDYRNIKLNIDGFRDINDVVEIFEPELFQTVSSATKEQALKMICNNATQYYGLEGLEEEIEERELIGSTFFTKDIAVPHPMYAVSSDTFVSVFYSKKAIVWDEDGNQVNLIMLLHVGKNNPQAFQMWNYFSKIFVSRSLIEQLSHDSTYDNFIYLIKQALKNGINSNEL
jgi:lichenan operon transcriptional antiterminator